MGSNPEQSPYFWEKAKNPLSTALPPATSADSQPAKHYSSVLQPHETRIVAVEHEPSEVVLAFAQGNVKYGYAQHYHATPGP